MGQITAFIITLIVFSIIATFMGSLMGALAVNYTIPYDNSTLDSYNQLTALSTQVAQVSNATTQVKQGTTGFADTFSSVFNDAFSTILLMTSSFNVFDTIANHAVQDVNLGFSGQILRIALGSIVLMLLFGTVIYAITGRVI